jgi:small nuclear ribonucleoprotein (snRNP)-like protein
MQANLFNQDEPQEPKQSAVKGSPGTSNRTPMKHDVLNKMISKEAGMYSAPMFHYRQAIWADVCAGDGTKITQDANCSPELFIKHAANVLKNSQGFDHTIYLVEKKASTYATLLQSVDRYMNQYLRELRRFPESDCDTTRTSISRTFINELNDCTLTIKTIHADSKTEKVIDWEQLNRQDLAFINNDPNNVEDFAIDPAEYEQVAKNGVWVQQFSTLGCNPSGLKRRPFEGRLIWYQNIAATIEASPEWHKPIMFAFGNDKSRWGYMITTYGKNFDKCKDEIIKAYGSAVVAGQLKNYDLLISGEIKGINKIIEYLVLTVEELEVQTGLSQAELYNHLKKGYGVPQ